MEINVDGIGQSDVKINIYERMVGGEGREEGGGVCVVDRARYVGININA